MGQSIFKRSTLAIAIALALASCSAAFKDRLADGYQIGDLSAAELENLEIYCTSTDPAARAAARLALGAIFSVVIPFNPCGLLGALSPESVE